MESGVESVGRKKKVGRDGGELPPMKTIGVRGTEDWCGWTDRFAKFKRMDVAKLVDAALVRYAEEEGFDEPPPERVP